MKRKSYDKQFKMVAVKLILEEEVPVSVVAKELEIHHSVNKIYGFRGMTMNINCQMNKDYNHKRIYHLMKDE